MNVKSSWKEFLKNIKETKIYQEGNLWRWKIIKKDGDEYSNSGEDFLTEQEAKESLANVLKL